MAEIKLPFKESDFSPELKGELQKYKSKKDGNIRALESMPQSDRDEADKKMAKIRNFYVLDYAGGVALRDNDGVKAMDDEEYTRTAMFKCILMGTDCYFTPTGTVFSMMANCTDEDRLKEVKETLKNDSNVRRCRIRVYPDAKTKQYGYLKSSKDFTGAPLKSLDQFFDTIPILKK